MNAVPAGDFSLVKTCPVSGDAGGFQLDLQRAALGRWEDVRKLRPRGFDWKQMESTGILGNFREF